MRLLNKYLSLDPADRVLVAQAFILVGAVRAGLAVMPYRTIYRVLQQTSHGRAVHSLSVVEQAQYRRRVVKAVRTAARKLLGDKPCLPQALAAQWFLRRAGVESTLRIGVRKDEKEELLAHAWLEYGDSVIIGGDSSPDQYRPLAPVSGSGQTPNSAVNLLS